MSEDPTPYQIPSYLEKVQSQLPALQLLIEMGWEYLSPTQCNDLRSKRLGSAILEPILTDFIREHGRYTFKGSAHIFTENAIVNAVQALKAFRATGAIHQNEEAYDLLCLGTSVPQTVDGDTKSFSISYLDWKNPENNRYHCTAEFKVERVGHQKYYIPDIVLYVNGVPFVVIECKRAAYNDTKKKPIDLAIGQLRGYQQKDGIPQVFLYSQLLLALARDKAEYGTTGTPRKFWTAWREEGLDEAIEKLITKPVPEDSPLLTVPFEQEAAEFLKLHHEGRTVTGQDWILYALCRPERLLQLTYQGIVFDNGTKKIARYQQFFAVEDILKRVRGGELSEPRAGGVVWQTQGSGKSLTMVMLAKALALAPDILTPKIILVTDRIDLDDQICGTFRACGLQPEQASTGQDLVDLLNDNKAHVVTTLIHKFEAATKNRNLKEVSRDTFVLVDEGHRSNYSEHHARMKMALKGACFIAFTGTPLATKKVIKVTKDGKKSTKIINPKRSTFEKFGPLFTPPYTISQAVEDKAVTPLLYKSCFDEFGQVRTEILMSGPNTSEGEDSEKKKEVSKDEKAFWERMMDRYGSEDKYNKQLINAFKKGEEPEIIIVVDKLLTGFDAPCNTVLYLARTLKGQTLLQAIARVNRLFDGKEYGLILDYSGVIEELDEAIDFYSQLADFDESDLTETVHFVEEVADKLPQYHSDLWELFPGLKGKSDPEVFTKSLRDEEKRARFYGRFSLFARTLSMALASTNFLTNTPEETIQRYKIDLKFFANLRAEASIRFQERIDFSEYEPRIQKLLDTHVSAGKIINLCEPINLFDAKERQKVLEDQGKSTEAKADMIASATQRTIEKEMTKDPAFYEKFSRMLRDVLEALHQKQMNAIEALAKIQDIATRVATHTDDRIPEVLAYGDMARRYYGVVREDVPQYNAKPTAAIKIAQEIQKRLGSHKIRDWRDNEDAVHSKASWIARQLDELSAFLPLPTPQRYVSGETLVYLGRQYRIKVSKGDSVPAKLRGRFLQILTPDPGDRERVRQSVDQWYRSRAEVIFEQSLERTLPVALRHGANQPSLTIRKMRTRWGSCSATDRITLNLYLIQAPIHCIDYVVMHELCHTREFNHSSRFYSLLTRCMPDWKKRRAILKSTVITM